MEEHKIFIVLSLLLIYTLTISKNLFYVLLVIFTSTLLYYKKNIHLSIFFLLFYVLSIVVLNRNRKKAEHFRKMRENFQNQTIESNSTEESNSNEQDKFLAKSLKFNASLQCSFK